MKLRLRKVHLRDVGILAGILAVGFIVLWLVGYTPVTLPKTTLSEKEARKELHKLPAMLNTLLHKHVNTKGRVDYKGLAKDQATLDRFLAIVAKVSPDTHPKLFGEYRPHRNILAYWINAYNASVLRTVLHLRPWDNLHSAPRKIRFFILTRFFYGGKRYSLYSLEHNLLRARFRDPRFHFVLNCASRGCPHLPREAFVGHKIFRQLDRETKKFVMQTRNVRVDAKTKTIHLSSIFQWFREDFEIWANRYELKTEAEDRLIDYINYYRPDSNLLPHKGYKIQYIPYDWRMNKQ